MIKLLRNAHALPSVGNEAFLVRIALRVNNEAGYMSSAVNVVWALVELAVGGTSIEFDRGCGLKCITVKGDGLHALEFFSIVDQSLEELVGHRTTHLIRFAILFLLLEHLHSVMNHKGCSMPLFLPLFAILDVDDAVTLNGLLTVVDGADREGCAREGQVNRCLDLHRLLLWLVDVLQNEGSGDHHLTKVQIRLLSWLQKLVGMLD